MANQYLLNRMEINSAATSVGGMVSYALRPNIVSSRMAGGSELDPSKFITQTIAPEFEFVTLDVATVLALMIDGVKLVPHIKIASATDFWFTLLTDGGNHAATGIRMRLTKGVIVPVSLSNTGGLLQLRCAVYADFDLTNLPIVWTTGQTLPGGGLASAALWSLRAVQDHTTTLMGLTDISLDFNVRANRFTPSNVLYATETTLDAVAPTATWSSTDVAAALGVCGFGGKVAGANGLKFYLGQWATNAAGPVAGSSHYTLTMRAASVWCIEAIDFGATPLTVRFRAYAKGGSSVAVASAPLSLASGQALPSETAAATFMVGPFKDQSTLYEIQTGGGVQFNAAWNLHKADSLPWPDHCAIVRREPTFGVTPNSPEFVSGLTTAGRTFATAFAFFLRKLTVNSEPVANATAEHISITAAGGHWHIASHEGQHAQLVAASAVFTPVGAITISTGVAIS